MRISELNPDIALKSLLDGKVKVDAEARIVKVYAQGEQPNIGLDEDFITILYNGDVKSWTHPIGNFYGFLALTVNCKLNTNRTIRKNRLRRLVDQCVTLVNCKTAQRIFFELDPTNVITPPTINDTTGYAATTLNVAWHTI